ncbi:M20 metallopeptidase family protein [Aurantiacibacter gangjinensis]|uniref:Amidohydrolase n=1 Tax=Aurantiacibacter gangjinensis TaxID=502682 RepID=A0A0G9MLB1_9SPHN|nr:M20 family metallopeptidase [Aurantiacibacter gangjinensis]APE27397.1 Metal-dependent amidase/aminoacylase/carboxypeptidase [Aurantiacibacter gangjinensis]KLE31477.1 amidohydrolase [Aurantiacibacter gangjinensis]
MLTENLLAAARNHEGEITALRRAIHAEPELGLETPLTLAKVKEALADLPLEWRVGTSCTGAVAVLKGGLDGRRVLLRGDMDALPMQEHTGLEFASTIDGRMHACGHDAHTAMLAGAARVLAERKDDLAGGVYFMFQPGEEGFHGARFMLEDGLLDPLPDAAFALHVWPNAPHGRVEGRAGAMLASADQIDIVVRGKGGHASMPYDTVDPIPVASEIVLALQSMVTRRFNAAEATVLSITRMAGGTTHNVVPDTVELMGTIRTLSPERRRAVRELAERTAMNIAQAHGCEAEVTITEGFPATINDGRAVEIGAQVARALGGDESWDYRPHPTMGAEDFSYVLEKVPGAMFFIGAAAEGVDWQGCCGLHSSKMVLDESVMPRGSAFLAGCALQFLQQEWAAA